jgi:predicted nucleotidyltransferase
MSGNLSQNTFPMGLDAIKAALAPVFQALPAIKLVYLFGSTGRGEASQGSDYDFFVCLSGHGGRKQFNTKIDLQTQVSKALGTDNVDIVIHGLGDGPELAYAAVTEGKLLYEIEPYQLLFEPRILNEYFDFREMLRRHELTRT